MVMERGENKVFVISPIAYPENFEHYLQGDDVVAIDLLDTPENIFNRLVFSNDKAEIVVDRMVEEYHLDVLR